MNKCIASLALIGLLVIATAGQAAGWLWRSLALGEREEAVERMPL
jgi:hypothetical protein